MVQFTVHEIWAPGYILVNAAESQYTRLTHTSPSLAFTHTPRSTHVPLSLYTSHLSHCVVSLLNQLVAITGQGSPSL